MRCPLLLLTVLIAFHPASADSLGLEKEIRSLGKQPELAKERDTLVAISAKEAARPIIVRPPTLAVLLERYPESMKYQTKPAHQARLTDEEWERFALSLSDANLNGILAERLPRMAAAHVFSKDERILKHIVEQLTEMAAWKPLERPGTNSARQNLKYAPWLGTGWAVRGITGTLDILPPEALPAGLRETLVANLEEEIRGIRNAWKEQKLWYTREESRYSNQWVVPNEALVLASIFNGLGKHRDDYEAGVKNLLKSLNAQGEKGEFTEGGSYAALTMNSFLSAAEAAAAQGDRRLIDHPYLKRFPIWYVHHVQPGGRIINAFDSKVDNLDPNLLSRFVSAVRSPEALWMIRRDKRLGYGTKLGGLSARAVTGLSPQEPPLFAAYDIAARINWRSSWDDATAAGFWMRGGHASDSHDHQDRGHVSFSIGEREILIEAGLASYGIPEHPTHYRSVAAHNVLQVGNAAPDDLKGPVMKASGQILDSAHRSAPITVERMDASGGAASVDMSRCYDSTEKWVRHVTWDKKGVSVKDEVVLKEPDHVTFRWHLAAAADAAVIVNDGSLIINGIEVDYDGDSPVTATVEPMPGFDARLKKSVEHACVVLRSEKPVKSLTLNSRIRLKP
ncbi:heparinase II/III family protein [Luteolibacter sp. SL250]|uniref:heparinase II/III domain-containing protein n=1 Tax=Luteolibacter sp. SL250 TaxID=2995170 RepID=UPI0022709232|nr:heparinase II/III family protein [Luteolibacter sp. SL250]WAC18446.1 heparinase II/III family protein [Luteolibacter sp. SL250]